MTLINQVFREVHSLNKSRKASYINYMPAKPEKHTIGFQVESLQCKRLRLQLHISPQRGLSVCLSRSCTLLKLFNGYQCHLAGTLCQMAQPPRGRGDLGGQTPARTCDCKFNAAATWRTLRLSDSAFHQISLVLHSSLLHYQWNETLKLAKFGLGF